MKIKHIVPITSILMLVTGCGSLSHFYEPPDYVEVQAKIPPKIPTVTAETLCLDYNTDEVKAHKKYTGKFFMIKGKVSGQLEKEQCDLYGRRCPLIILEGLTDGLSGCSVIVDVLHDFPIELEGEKSGEGDYTPAPTRYKDRYVTALRRIANFRKGLLAGSVVYIE